MTTTRTTEALMDKIEYVVAEARQCQIPLESLIDEIFGEDLRFSFNTMVHRWQFYVALLQLNDARRAEGVSAASGHLF